MSSSNQNDIRTRLESLAGKAAEALGLEFVHLLWRREGPSWVLRLFLDRPDGGLSLEDCAQASEQFSALVDADEIITQNYTLEVSSPGLDRPLFKEDDYQRFAGRRATLTAFAPVDGRRHFRGVLAGCANGEVRIQSDEGEEFTLPFSKIASGKLEVDMTSPGPAGRERS